MTFARASRFALGACALMLFGGAARADLQEIALATDKGEPVRAILAKPPGAAAPNAKDPAASSAPAGCRRRP